jgi:hypothetical protein
MSDISAHGGDPVRVSRLALNTVEGRGKPEPLEPEMGKDFPSGTPQGSPRAREREGARGGLWLTKDPK